jgi:hypothetical protein
MICQSGRHRWRGSRTYDLRILFRDLSYTGYIVCLSRARTLQTGFQSFARPCEPLSKRTESLSATILNRPPVLDCLRLGPRRYPVA